MTFNNVSVDLKANLYFDGKVSSRTLLLSDGKKVTLGIMLPGQYTFGTGAKELMEISAGRLSLKLSPDHEEQSITAGESFEVAANSEFNVVVHEVVDYCCHYIEE